MKGRQIDNVWAYLLARPGREEREEAFARLSKEDRTAIQTLAPASWYDVQLYVRLVRAVCDRGRADDLWTAQQVGRFGADRDFTTVHRWFLRLMKPSFALRNMNVYWRRTQDTGSWRSEVGAREIVAELSGWDAVDSLVCHRLLGYLGRTLELMRCERAKIAHTSCRTDGAPACVFRASCDMPSDRLRPDRITSDADLVDMLRELSQLEDQDHVAEAIGELLRVQFDLCHVSLWLLRHGDPRHAPVYSTGTPGAGPQSHHVLEAAGQLFGRLSVATRGASPLREADASTLERMLPHFAAALRGARTSSPAGDRTAPAAPAPEGADFARIRDERARAWRLTPRETAVLGACVVGRTNKEIAQELGCAEVTVEVHMSRIFRKASAGNRASLVARFWSEGAGREEQPGGGPPPPAGARAGEGARASSKN